VLEDADSITPAVFYPRPEALPFRRSAASLFFIFWLTDKVFDIKPSDNNAGQYRDDQAGSYVYQGDLPSKNPQSIIRATSLIIGEDTRKENVAPKGTPASIKPRKSGMALQEQKGVTIPKTAASILPVCLCLWLKMERVFSGEKKLRMKETVKMIAQSKRNIFTVS